MEISRVPKSSRWLGVFLTLTVLAGISPSPSMADPRDPVVVTLSTPTETATETFRPGSVYIWKRTRVDIYFDCERFYFPTFSTPLIGVRGTRTVTQGKILGISLWKTDKNRVAVMATFVDIHGSIRMTGTDVPKKRGGPSCAAATHAVPMVDYIVINRIARIHPGERTRFRFGSINVALRLPPSSALGDLSDQPVESIMNDRYGIMLNSRLVDLLWASRAPVSGSFVKAPAPRSRPPVASSKKQKKEGNVHGR